MSEISEKFAAFFEFGDEFVRRGRLEAAGVDFLGEAEEWALVAFEKLQAEHRLKRDCRKGPQQTSSVPVDLEVQENQRLILRRDHFSI